jgi:hypothetical protein|tara:strand:+ start:187 stop:429 length:243 start_codon:yes stop_codon:yes gene_type:complete
MKLTKILEIWDKFVAQVLAEQEKEEEILDEEEEFQKTVKRGYVKNRNKYLKSGPQDPGVAYPKKTKDTRAKSAPPGFGGA